MYQHTIKQQTIIEGIGLHSGLPSRMVIKPSPVDTGVVFKRVDLPSQPEVKALYTNVFDTKNCTCLSVDGATIVNTIEHFMSVLYVLKIDNVLVEIDNLELPIMDGSAEPFYTALKAVGVQEQEAKRATLVVKKEIMFADDKGASVVLRPSDEGLRVSFTIEFPSKVVGKQIFSDKIAEALFAADIAPCRTFCEKSQIDHLKSVGLIKGGSLDNALVLDGDCVLNEDGLRRPFECVKHKVLDAVGDLYTAGYPISGELLAYKTGHYHNNQILKILFSDKSNYELV